MAFYTFSCNNHIRTRDACLPSTLTYFGIFSFHFPVMCLGLDSLCLSTQSPIQVFMYFLILRKYLTVFSLTISPLPFFLFSPSGMLMG